MFELQLKPFQLKQSFNRVKTLVIWLAGDWLLADALTKKSQDFAVFEFRHLDAQVQS